MATGKRWTRDELLILLNIYEKLPFGQFDQAQLVVQDLAKHMGRTPGSVAMKLCNLASLDPAIKARGRKGLPGVSNLDCEIWNEFHSNRDELAPQSEEKFRDLFHASNTDELELVKGVGVRRRKAFEPPNVPTEFTGEVKLRRGQQFFRQVVLNTFDGRCCVTGIAFRELLVASHILPWSSHPAERLHSQNGLCLSRLHDGAFDRGLMTLDEKLRVVLSKELRAAVTNATLKQSFLDFEGTKIFLPSGAFPPKQEFLNYHREKIFRS